jgi:hypothetical protein
MHVEVAQHHANHFGVRVHLDDILHGLSKLDLHTALGDQHFVQFQLYPYQFLDD